MATSYGNIVGNAKNAPESVDPTNRPDPQHFADFKAKIDAKRTITVKAIDSIRLIGYAPGEDTDGEPKCIPIPAGGIARVIKEGEKSSNQPAAVLADFCARGRIQIVADGQFTKAEDHKAIATRNREADLARQAELAGGDLGDVTATLVGQAEMLKAQKAENEAMRKEMAALKRDMAALKKAA